MIRISHFTIIVSGLYHDSVLIICLIPNAVHKKSTCRKVSRKGKEKSGTRNPGLDQKRSTLDQNWSNPKIFFLRFLLRCFCPNFYFS